MIASRGACFMGGATAVAVFLLFGFWLLAILAFATGCVAAQFVPPPGLDPERFFPTADRIKLWEDARGICQKCGQLTHFEANCPDGGDCPLDYQADHKYPHSKGGRTVLSNGACLCRRCNARKGART